MENVAPECVERQRRDEPTLENIDWELYKAVDKGDKERFTELLDLGGDVDGIFVDEANISTKSLLHICCEKGKLECVKILMERNANLSSRDNWGQTPLMFCILAGRTEVAELMLKFQPSLIHDMDKYGDTCLHFAAQNGLIEFMEIFFRHNAYVDAGNQSGFTPLMSSILSRDIELPVTRSDVTKLLLARGADVDMREPRGKRTALQLAVFCKDVEVVEILLQAGADPNKADRTGRIPLTNCILENITVQREPGSQPQIDDNILSMLVLLTQAGTNLNLTMCEYSHPLVCASFVGSPELVKFFMDHGSIPDMSFPSGVTPILTAVSRNQMNVVKHLLYWNCRFHDRGRISRKRVDYYFDPFELAIFLKYWNMAKLLLHAGYHWVAGSIEKDEDLVEPLLTSEDMTKWYTDYIRTPQSLQFNCIVVIRSSLGANITEKVKELHLPPFINNKILMEALLCKEAS